MTTTHLINRMPSRVLGMKSPYEMLFGKNEFVVPPKVFGCTCFVRDHRPLVGKLDPQAIKCIFVGYSSGQKGYKCWSPSEHRMFVSMDVTFKESVPFYGERNDLSDLFFDLDSSCMDENSIQEESEILGVSHNEKSKRKGVLIGSIPCPMTTINEPIREEGGRPHAEETLRVYTRRRKDNQIQPTTSCDEITRNEEQLEIVEQQQFSVPDDPELETGGEEANLDLPIALRKGVRSTAGKPPTMYGFESGNDDDDGNHIANYVSYESLSSVY